MNNQIEKVVEFMQACGQDMTVNNSLEFGDYLEHLSLVDLYKKLVVEESAELLKEFIAGYCKDELKEICDLIWVLIGYAHLKGYDIIGAFNEVARSNMSKIDPETGVVLKNDDGKVIKPPSYSPADMSDFVVITSSIQ